MIAAYHSKSWTSKAIRFFTWSDISHVALVDPYDAVYQSLTDDGVCKVGSADLITNLSRHHTEGTLVDIYEIRIPDSQYPDGKRITAEQWDLIHAFCESQLGKHYDWRGVFSFITRRNIKNRIKDFLRMRVKDRWPQKWFCSDFVFVALGVGHITMLNLPYYKVSPAQLVSSPLCHKVRTIRTIKDV